MANYYTEFSVLLPIDGLQAADVQNFIQNYQPYDPDDSIDFDITLREDGVWLHPEEAGSPELAADFIEAYLKYFDIPGGIFMSWANYCSKPRINEASGGGVVVTKDRQLWISSFDAWRQAEEKGIDVINGGY